MASLQDMSWSVVNATLSFPRRFLLQFVEVVPMFWMVYLDISIYIVIYSFTYDNSFLEIEVKTRGERGVLLRAITHPSNQLNNSEIWDSLCLGCPQKFFSDDLFNRILLDERKMLWSVPW